MEAYVRSCCQHSRGFTYYVHCVLLVAVGSRTSTHHIITWCLMASYEYTTRVSFFFSHGVPWVHMDSACRSWLSYKLASYFAVIQYEHASRVTAKHVLVFASMQ